MITEWSSEAEVAEFNDARFCDENVFRLHVSMNTLNINVKYKRKRHSSHSKITGKRSIVNSYFTAHYSSAISTSWKLKLEPK